MSIAPITLEALKTIDAIERRGSFAKAAEELDKATSAVSYSIQKMEEQLGVTLFQRQGRRSVLTPSGKLLLNEGRKILTATNVLADQVRELSSGWEPRLRIGLESIIHRQPVYQALNTLLNDHPNLEVDIQECVLNGGWEALEIDSIDLLIGAPAPVPLQKGFRSVSIAPVDMLLVAASTHPIFKAGNGASAPVKQLANYRRIVTHDTAKFNVVRNQGLTSGEVLYVQTIDQKIEALAAGLGIGHVPRKLIQPLLDNGNLTCISTEETIISDENCYIAWKINNKGKALSMMSKLVCQAFQ